MFGFSSFSRFTFSQTAVNPNATVSITGVSATGGVGSAGVNGDADSSVTGVAGTGTVG